MGKLFNVSFEQVVSLENLCEAWQEFLRGKRNRKDVREFRRNLGDELAILHDELVSGEYKHGPYHAFIINDPKPRRIHKASVRDRLLHHALYRQLYPHFSKVFIAGSFSCQKEKGVHKALVRFQEYVGKAGRNNTRTCWVLKCDIQKFFANIHHHTLLDLLRKRIVDDRLMGLLGNIVDSFHVSPDRGIPLGNLTSQLFGNIYMNKFDHFIKNHLRMQYYLRYTDDFVFFSHDRIELEHCLSNVAVFLREALALELHPDKVSIKTLSSGVDFLGWVHFPHHRLLRTKTKKRMLTRIRKHSKPETFQSYLGLLKHGDTHELQTCLLNDYWLWGHWGSP